MGVRLQIGEIAKLAGVTPKTVRHYTRLGLLSEPERTEGNYRLYTPRDLLRLQRIRQLQALGLSLAEIKTVLGEPDREQTLRSVLESVLHELDTQIAALEERRSRVKKLLSEENSLEELEPPSPGLEAAREYLEGLQVPVSQAVWEQEKKIWRLLEGFQWPGNVQELQKEMLAYFEANQEVFRPLVALLEQFAALANLPEEAPEIDKLAEDWAAQLKQMPSPEHWKQLAWAEGKLGQVLSAMWAADFSPAQRRAMEKLKALQEKA